MLKDYSLVRNITSILNGASNNIGNRIIGLNQNINGREEEITAQLKTELTLHLLDEIEKSLNGVVIKGVAFDVYTFKKKQENKTGADLAGLITLTVGNKSISKIYLAQAKIGSHTGNDSFGNPILSFYNKDILSQVDNMLKLTSDSFVFIYSTIGIYVIPALEVRLFNNNSISTDHFYFHTFGKFYEEFFKCFIGDHKISRDYVNPEDLPIIAEENNVNNLVLIRAKMAE